MISSPRAPRHRGGRRPLLALFLALGLVAAFTVGAPAEAGDKASGRIDIEAALEPADAKPGSKATLVFKLTPLDKEAEKLPGAHFIYAAGEKAIKYKALEAQGVTYHLDKATRTDPGDVKDFDEVYKAWTKPFEIRVPVTLGNDVKDGTTVGLDFHYYGCLQNVACYAPIKSHKAGVVIGDPVGDPVPSGPIGDSVDGGSAEIRWNEEKQQVEVTFTPEFLHWMYGPGAIKGKPISVTPVKQDGLEWGDVKNNASQKFDMPETVEVPVKKRDDKVKRIEVLVTFQACNDQMCLGEVERKMSITWPGAKAMAVEEAPPAPPGEVMFPIVEGDKLGGEIAAGEDESSLVQKYMDENPALGLGAIFLFGLLLAFTPCVLPIIPITVSVITGGNPDIEKKRLNTLLLMYVAGLSLAFATLGTIAAYVGGGVSDLFALPATQWGIAILFILLAFSMIGVYELQPPAWLMKLQGGAQKRSGSIIGAFMFGILGAIIASPCTAPAVAGMLIVTAKTGSLTLGFLMFFMLGLGMGAVFYAAGALNFLMRPGPWMVWIRYAFGVMLYAMAMYYLFGKGLIGAPTLWVLGMIICAAAAYGIYWHLTTKEGEDKGRARTRGIQVAATWVAATVLIFLFAAPFTGEWTKVKDRQHLATLVKEANAEGKPVVVDFWAIWCATCVEYDKLIEEDPELNKLFTRVAKLKVDVGNDAIDHKDIRDALGMGREAQGQPYMVMIDKDGRIRRAADVTGWYNSADESAERLKARLAVILGTETEAKPAPAAAGKVETGDTGK